MNKNKFNLRSVVAIAICLVVSTAFVGCSCKENPENSIVGKWMVVRLNHPSTNPTFIVFTEDLRVEQYFDEFLALCECSLPYVTYSLSDNRIALIIHNFNSDVAIKHSGEFEYVLNGNYLTIKLFSNPFGQTFENRFDVHFTRVR